jgi:hypothetical protein
LEQWVDRLAQYAMTKHGLAGALQKAAQRETQLSAEIYESIVQALARLLDAAGQAGIVRAELDPDDVILALAGLWQIDPSSDWKPRARAVYRIIMSGLEPR